MYIVTIPKVQYVYSIFIWCIAVLNSILYACSSFPDMYSPQAITTRISCWLMILLEVSLLCCRSWQIQNTKLNIQNYNIVLDNKNKVRMSRKEQKCLLSTVKLMYRLTNYNQIYTRNFSTHVAQLNVNEPHFPMATKLNCYSCMFVIFFKHNNNFVHSNFNVLTIKRF